MTREDIDNIISIICPNDEDYEKICISPAYLKKELETLALEQEPKTGHWIYICNSEVNGLKIVECSECGKRTYGSGKYCPHCGVRMIAPQESEDKENI